MANLFEWLDMTSKNAAPIVAALNGGAATGNGQMQDARNRWNAVNGSGPNNPSQAANQAPRNLWDFLLGRQQDGTVSYTNPLLLLGVGIIVTLLIWKFALKR